jgi:hypothetical protein
MEQEMNNFIIGTILDYGKVFENVIIKSLDYDIVLSEDIVKNVFAENVEIKNKKTGKSTKHMIFLFGMYMTESEEYIWYKGIQGMFMDHLKQYDKLVAIPFIKNYFIDTTIKISYNFKNVIPYLMAIIYSGSNLVRFTSPDKKVELYAMVDLGIKDNFNMRDFLLAMSTYSLFTSMNKKDINNLSRSKIEKSISLSRSISKKLIEKSKDKIKSKSKSKSKSKGKKSKSKSKSKSKKTKTNSKRKTKSKSKNKSKNKKK